MKISIGDRWKGVIDQAVESGSYTSAEDVVTEALRLFASEQAKYEALKASIAEALADPRFVTDAEMDAALAEVDAELRAEGYE
jgi:putative addiction module CopG family antidote